MVGLCVESVEAMDRNYRITERKILQGEAEEKDWVDFYRYQRYLGIRNQCVCAQFHQIEPCQIPGCLNLIPRFFCDDEYCSLCGACSSTGHSVHYECDRCSRRGCQTHFQECVACESRGWDLKYCSRHINEEGLCRGMRIESSMPGLLPHGYVRGCADL